MHGAYLPWVSASLRTETVLVCARGPFQTSNTAPQPTIRERADALPYRYGMTDGRATRRSTPQSVAAERTSCHRRPIRIGENKAPGGWRHAFVLRTQGSEGVLRGGEARLLRRAARKVDRAPKGKTPAVCTAQSRRYAALRNPPRSAFSVR